MPPSNLRFNRRTSLKTSLALAGALIAVPPALTQAQQGHAPSQATPASESTPISTDDFGLVTLLSLIPQSRLAAVEGEPYWSYCDFQRQFASLGLHHDISGPDLENEPAAIATLALAPGAQAFSFAMVEEFAEAIGFHPLGVNQSLSMGSPPEMINLFRGVFEPEALIAAWEAAGYVLAETNSGTSAWTIGPDGEFDVENPIQSFVIASMNNVAIVNDVLVYTNTLALLNEVLDHIADGTPSLADDEVFGPIIQTLPQTIVSSMGLAPIIDISIDPLSPEQIEAIQGELDEAREIAGPMPQMTAMVVAVDEGAVPLDFEWNDLDVSDAGTMFVRIGYQTQEDAQQAAEVVVARAESVPSLVTGAPMSDLIEPVNSGVEGTTAMVDFTQLESPRVWSSMIFSRDVLLFIPDDAS